MYKDFDIEKDTLLREVIIIKPDTFTDHRGLLYTDYLKSFIQKSISSDLSFDHSKYANNKHGVLRGIHGDFESWKMVNCVYGEIFQVVVDNRKNSDTYLKHSIFNLNHHNPQLLLIPPGFGNAFYVKSEFAVYNYKLSYLGEYNDYDEQFTLKWNDERLGIDWPTESPILSNRDK